MSWPRRHAAGDDPEHRLALQRLARPKPRNADHHHQKLPPGKRSPKSASLATGAGTFSGTTDSTGCAILHRPACRQIHRTPSGRAGRHRRRTRRKAESTSVVASGTTTAPAAIRLRSKDPGQLQVPRRQHRSFEPATATRSIVYNSLMTPAKAYWTSGKYAFTNIVITPVFPFTSPDTIYAGTCSKNNPGEGPGLANIVPAGRHDLQPRRLNCRCRRLN